MDSNLISCPACRGTGYEFEEARLLHERKAQLTEHELVWLINRKAIHQTYTTDGTTSINMKITKTDIFNVIKNRGLLLPCICCQGKGKVKVHSSGN